MSDQEALRWLPYFSYPAYRGSLHATARAAMRRLKALGLVHETAVGRAYWITDKGIAYLNALEVLGATL